MKLPNPEQLQAFEDNLARNEKLTVAQKFSIANKLYQHAKMLGILPMKDSLFGIEYDIERTRLIHGLRISSR